MSVDIIDLFQIIHIKENEVSVGLLHKLRRQALTEISHRKCGEQVVVLGIFLCLNCDHYIRDEFADGSMVIRKIRSTAAF